MRLAIIGGVSAIALTTAALALNFTIPRFLGSQSTANAAGAVEKPSAINGSNYAVVPGAVDRLAGGFLNSYFRLFNGGAAQANFSVTVVNATGATVGAATTIAIPPMAARQFKMEAILDLVAPGTAAGGTYAVYISTPETMAGYQHVMFNDITSLYENASACRNLLTQMTLPYSNSLVLIDVHTSIIEAFGFPMQIQVHNYATRRRLTLRKSMKGPPVC
jgi:hypothetical protein